MKPQTTSLKTKPEQRSIDWQRVAGLHPTPPRQETGSQAPTPEAAPISASAPPSPKAEGK
jgi:hypothetical protein